MISVNLLLKSIENNTATWQLADIKTDIKEAKKYAAQVYAQEGIAGTKVLRFEDGKFAIIFWQRGNK